MQVEPFRIAVPDAVLDDLRERLARTRFPDEIPDSGWTYGTNLAYLRELVAYWRERYDWRLAEARLNGLPQFRAHLGVRDAAPVVGIHLNMVLALPEGPKNPDLTGVTQEEVVDLMQAQAFLKEETGYQRIQGTKPQTLAYALNDSPAGLAAWIVEKFRTWSDCGGEIERRFSKDQLLTNVMLYWLTETANSSCRLYYEAMHAGKFAPRDVRVDVPTGCALFPKELVRPPRRWAERAYNVQRW